MSKTTDINTQGGSVVGGNVNAGSDFVGRDQHKYIIDKIVLVGQFLDFAQIEGLLPKPSNQGTNQSIEDAFLSAFKDGSSQDIAKAIAFVGTILGDLLPQFATNEGFTPRNYTKILNDLVPVVQNRLVKNGYWSAFAHESYDINDDWHSYGKAQIVFLPSVTRLWNKHFADDDYREFGIAEYRIFLDRVGYTKKTSDELLVFRSDDRSRIVSPMGRVNLEQFRIIMVGLVMDLIRMASTIASDGAFWNGLMELLSPSERG